MGVQVHVEYCSGWGYSNKYHVLRKKIIAEVPGAEVTGNTGRSRSFEIKVNGKLVFSKLKLGGFPNAEDVQQAVIEAEKGLEPLEINTCSPEDTTCEIS